jgi:hypothetical protein
MNLKCYVVDDEYHSVEMLIEYIDKTDGLDLQGFFDKPTYGFKRCYQCQSA